jgi:hypothetical protein
LRLVGERLTPDCVLLELAASDGIAKDFVKIID